MHRSIRQGRESKGWITSKWSLAAVAVICSLIGASLVKELVRSYRINKEIDDLRLEISSLETKNEEFSEFVEYLKTDLYAEEQARVKLGMKSPGEKLIILKEGDTGEQISGEHNSGALEGIVESGQVEGNISKWWRYFWQPRQA